MSKPDIITVGDVSQDVFVRPIDLKIMDNRAVASGKIMALELGEKIPVEDVIYDVGGSAANVSVGLSRLGYDTAILTAIGTDVSAEKIINRLEDEQVDLSHLVQREYNKTNFAVIINTPNGERTILVHHGINYRQLKLKKKNQVRWIYLGPVGEDSEKLIDDVVALGRSAVKIAWNPGSYQVREGALKYRDLLKITTVLFVNREEAMKLIDLPVRPTDEVLLRKLVAFGPKLVVMTKGKGGAKAYDGTNYYQADIIKDVKLVDATGAGDSFASGVLGRLMVDIPREKLTGLARDRALEFEPEAVVEALRWGIVNSTSVISRIGAQSGLLTHSQMTSQLEKYREIEVAREK